MADKRLHPGGKEAQGQPNGRLHRTGLSELCAMKKSANAAPAPSTPHSALMKNAPYRVCGGIADPPARFRRTFCSPPPDLALACVLVLHVHPSHINESLHDALAGRYAARDGSRTEICCARSVCSHDFSVSMLAKREFRTTRLQSWRLVLFTLGHAAGPCVLLPSV